ncbi:MAG TPA: NAD(P)-dependent alcohol dehydrogenase [Candidatus Polarisedimenticolia bacterium]|nr:NAD(P)-dependent alcohol dehydrogenase [Candidatus Polarisedimenticolia bacterium]
MSTTPVESFVTTAYGAPSATAPLTPISIKRRQPGPKDVQIDIQFCGVCHSDLHQVRNEWQSVMPTTYPCVPGHEIIGRVVAVGKDVRAFKEGDRAGVGCLVDSCRTCPSCREGLEQFCVNMPTFTYNAEDKALGGVTYGGYSRSIVVNQDFVLRVPNGLDPAAAAPLLCAGITTFSPLRTWNVGKGSQVGVVGLGGLGHMAVKFARAFGAHVVLFTTSPSKSADALRLGAHEVVMSRDQDAMLKRAGTLDFILDTVSATHDLNPFIACLKRDATMTLIGAPEQPTPVAALGLIFGRKRLAGSLIGGLRQTQEMLDFCGEHGITSDIETIRIQGLNDAFGRLLKSDVKYRFVIDMASLA